MPLLNALNPLSLLRKILEGKTKPFIMQRSTFESAPRFTHVTTIIQKLATGFLGLLFIPIVIVLMLLSPRYAFADGLIIIEPPQIPSLLPDVQLAVKEHHVKVVINGGIATTTIEQIFYNPNSRTVEGTYIFPIPGSAAIANFSMTWQGETVQGEVLPKDEARRIYEDVVKRQTDPALLEYIGRDLFRARIFPVGPKESKNTKLVYSEVVQLERGNYRYRYPLNTERFSSQKLERVSVKVDITMPQAIKNIYSPSHKIKISHEKETHVITSYIDEQTKPDQDFLLFWGTSQDDVGINLLTYQEYDEDGYFILLASPKVDWPDTSVLAKNIVLVLDNSGSMSGVKIEQAKEALKYIVTSLRADDRFAIIHFNDEVYPLHEDLVKADKKETTAVNKKIGKIEAGGGTDIDSALKTALRLLKTSTERPQVVVFLTDGEPTSGVTATLEIVKNVRTNNLANAKIFVFGVGNDVNAHLLDFISGDSKGISSYVAPEENITTKVGEFYDKIASPVLENLELKFNGADVYDLYPKEITDLYKGSQITIAGRYRNGRGDKLEVVLNGLSGKTKQEFKSNPYLLGTQDKSLSDVPLIWAARKVGYLLDQIRLHGENDELIDEVVRISRLYGIINEYTSFLIDVDPDLPLSIRKEKISHGLRESLSSLDFDAPIGSAGTGAAKSTQALQSASNTQAGFTQTETSSQIKRVGAKIFYLAGNRWVDSVYHGGRAVLPIKYGSKAYYDALGQLDLGPYFSIGKELLVCLHDNCYEISSTGETDLANLEVFKDVAALHWSSKYFKELHDKEVVAGTKDGRALPDQPVTRAEFLKIVLKFAEINTDKADTKPIGYIRDIKPSDWYAPYIAIAIERGIISGYEDATFKPNKPVTRAEALKILFNTFLILPTAIDDISSGKEKDGAADNAANKLVFNDIGAGDWFATYILRASRLGIISGYKDGNFHPNAHISRAEAVKIIVETNKKKALANPNKAD